MINQYNFYNLEASFIKFLNSGNRNLSKVTLKNYISDLRHFFGWFIFRLKSSQEYTEIVDKLDIPALITNCLNSLIVAQYKAYLIANAVPLQTSNRRLSTLRKLSEFFISQRWINENPTANLRNITNIIRNNDNKYYIQDESTQLVLNEYKKALQSPLRQSDSEASQNLDDNEIDLIIRDINEFLNFK